MEYFTLVIGSLTRKLPLSYISRQTRLASFSLLGDVELVDYLADTIAKKLKSIAFDYVVGPEVKVVPLVHGIAKRLGHKRYVICRKSVKPYMVSPVILKPLPTAPKHVKPLVISGLDAEFLKGKKVVIVDDVVSTGVTMRMLDVLMEKVGATVILHIAVCKQGKQFSDSVHVMTLAELPIVKYS